MWTYSPADVSASILGIDVTGYASDTFISIESDSPTFTYRKSMDGGTMAIANKFNAYNVKLTLHQSSPSNTWLHLLHGLFSTYGIAFKMPVLIRDNSGSTTFFCTDCWFDKEPSVTFANTLQNTEWNLRCNRGTMSIGGNGDNSHIADILQSITTALGVADSLGVNLGAFESRLQSLVG